MIIIIIIIIKIMYALVEVIKIPYISTPVKSIHL